MKRERKHILIGPCAKLKRCATCGAVRQRSSPQSKGYPYQKVLGAEGLYRCRGCGAELLYSISREWTVLGVWTLGNLLLVWQVVAVSRPLLERVTRAYGRYNQQLLYIGISVLLSLVILNVLYGLFPIYVRAGAGARRTRSLALGLLCLVMAINIVTTCSIAFVMGRERRPSDLKPAASSGRGAQE